MEQCTMTQTARSRAVANQDAQIQDNVAKIEQARRPTALDMMASRLNVSAGGLKNTLLNTVFAKASDDEFAALIMVANAYGLNPLTKEIYAFPANGGGIVPVVSIDGWLRIMNEHPQFDGIEFEDIADDNGKLLAVEAVIYRKDRSRPIRVTEYLSECQGNTDPWKKLPARMLRHKATIQCARYAFGFSGISSEDDAEVGDVRLGGDLRAVAPTRQATAGNLKRLETIPHDAQTGEIVDDPEVTAELDRQAYAATEGRTDEQHGDQHDDTDHPALALITRFNRAELKKDFTVIAAEFETVANDLPDDVYQDIKVAKDAAAERLGVEG